jgi:hypothetical protein
MFVPAGVALVQGLRRAGSPAGQNWHSAGLVLSILLPLLIGMIAFINWPLVAQTAQTGQWPRNKVMDFGEAVLARVQPGADEMLIGTHELLWVLPDSLNFYSPISEGIAETQRGWTGTQVWDYLAPDIYVETPQRIATPPGLQAYLDREQFLICDEFDAVGYLVRVYRRSCLSP